ncbi:MAG: hypothetical protein E6K81_04880 [Candidatus Eisenbacteria bacterium]|uniref:Uncharacterized protein n=1 Tax=Eiseniibacteriota bacterium TaxID=2212470 RepID=A0A538UBZ0_UNCEI|nr:MAG: hypothetical protein E6K81_04880 [Candidatus Eisenbacteria bacterium]
MDPAWHEHLEALKRFNTWEDEQLRGLRESYADALAWMADAWELASRTDASWCSETRGDEHVRHLVRLHASLQKARLRP